MSITSDLRNDLKSYADTAIGQGRAVAGGVVGQAQSQLGDVAGQATVLVNRLGELARGNAADVADFAGKASGAIGDFRAQAEKTLNIDALRSSVEPYFEQTVGQAAGIAKHYGSAVTDRAEGVVSAVVGTVAADPRVSKVLATGQAIGSVVVDTVNHRVVEPVVSLAGRGRPKSESSSGAQASAPKTKPAATRPATKRATKPAAKRATKATSTPSTARKTAARKTAAASSTATKAAKSTARKSAATPASPAKKTASRKTATKATPASDK